METTVLSEITKRLEAGEKHELRVLANFIQDKVDMVDPLEWETFKEVVMNVYDLDEHQFRERLRSPVFYRDGLYVDDFRSVLTEYKIGGFLRRYVDFWANSESPSSYHFASALTILGAALERQCWYDNVVDKVYPAIQSFIFGPSGKVAKSTCTRNAMKMLEASNRGHRFADVITPEGLRKSLSERTMKTGEACGILYSSELGTLFTKQEGYNQGLIQMLTEFFDSPDSGNKETKTGGLEKVSNVALSFLAASNQGWAAQAIPESAFGGGFLGRSLLWYAEGAVRIVPEPTIPDPVERENLTSMLTLTQFVDGEFIKSEAARKWYNEKYTWIKCNFPDDERTDPFWTRYGTHLLRVGMLMRISEMIEEAQREQKAILDMPRVIDVKHFEQADAILLWIIQYIPRVYSFLGLSKHGEETARILRYIARNEGSVPQGRLTRYMIRFMSVNQLNEHLKGLLSSGVLKCETIPPPHLDGSRKFTLSRPLEEF